MASYIGLACIGLYVVLFCIAAIGDIRALTIPNWIPILLIGAFPAFALATGDVSLINHFAVGLAALVIGIAIYALGWMAGGDVKLIAAAAVWAGPSLVAPFLLVMAAIGGLLGLGVLVVRRLSASKSVPGSVKRYFPRWAVRGLCPYGVPISASALLLTPQFLTKIM